MCWWELEPKGDIVVTNYISYFRVLIPYAWQLVLYSLSSSLFNSNLSFRDMSSSCFVHNYCGMLMSALLVSSNIS